MTIRTIMTTVTTAATTPARSASTVLESIFAENDTRADINRAAFETNGIRALNLMSSPGSGKTTVLAATLDELAGDVAIGVIEGDIATDIDAARLGGRGAQISLLNTNNGFGGECHLDAPMVNRALQGLDLPALDLVIIENVGNLVCPAEFDVGEHAKAMVYSVTEGEDKPLKYPGDVPVGRRGAAEQDRSGAASRRRRRHLHRPCAPGESDRHHPAGQRAYRRGYGRLVRVDPGLHRHDVLSRAAPAKLTRAQMNWLFSGIPGLSDHGHWDVSFRQPIAKR